MLKYEPNIYNNLSFTAIERPVCVSISPQMLETYTQLNTRSPAWLDKSECVVIRGNTYLWPITIVQSSIRIRFNPRHTLNITTIERIIEYKCGYEVIFHKNCSRSKWLLLKFVWGLCSTHSITHASTLSSLFSSTWIDRLNIHFDLIYLYISSSSCVCSRFDRFDSPSTVGRCVLCLCWSNLPKCEK